MAGTIVKDNVFLTALLLELLVLVNLYLLVGAYCLYQDKDFRNYINIAFRFDAGKVSAAKRYLDAFSMYCLYLLAWPYLR